MPDWEQGSETPRAWGILRIAEMGTVATLRRWRRMACPQQRRILLLLGWHFFDSSWAINIERSVMLLCDNGQGTLIRSPLVS